MPWFGKAQKTMKPHKVGNKKMQELLTRNFPTLGTDPHEAVKLPDGTDLNWWIAANTFDFFNQVSMLYGTIMDYCTEESCPKMTAGEKYEYLWADGKTIKKAIPCSAPKYTDYLMTWVENQIDCEDIFPKTPDRPFPANFHKVVSKIFTRLFRVYAHIYFSHLQQVRNLDEEAHLNTSLKHFVYFVRQYNLVDTKQLEPLAAVITTLCPDLGDA